MKLEIHTSNDARSKNNESSQSVIPQGKILPSILEQLEKNPSSRDESWGISKKLADFLKASGHLLDRTQIEGITDGVLEHLANTGNQLSPDCLRSLLEVRTTPKLPERPEVMHTSSTPLLLVVEGGAANSGVSKSDADFDSTANPLVEFLIA
jgi:hypothetical protein